MAGFNDACLFYGTFEGALKGLVTCDGDARHRSVDRSNACAAQKPRTTARECPARGYFRSGRREAQRRCGPRPGPSATMPVHATAARAGWVPSSGNIKARSLEPLASRTMIVP